MTVPTDAANLLATMLADCVAAANMVASINQRLLYAVDLLNRGEHIAAHAAAADIVEVARTESVTDWLHYCAATVAQAAEAHILQAAPQTSAGAADSCSSNAYFAARDGGKTWERKPWTRLMEEAFYVEEEEDFTPTQRDRWPMKITDSQPYVAGLLRSLEIEWSDGAIEVCQTYGVEYWLEIAGFNLFDYAFPSHENPGVWKVENVPGKDEPTWVSLWFRCRRNITSAAMSLFKEKERRNAHAVGDMANTVAIDEYMRETARIEEIEHGRNADTVATTYRPWQNTKKAFAWTLRSLDGGGWHRDYIVDAATGKTVAFRYVDRGASEPPALWRWAQNHGYELIPSCNDTPTPDYRHMLGDNDEWWTIKAT